MKWFRIIAVIFVLAGSILLGISTFSDQDHDIKSVLAQRGNANQQAIAKRNIPTQSQENGQAQHQTGDKSATRNEQTNPPNSKSALAESFAEAQNFVRIMGGMAGSVAACSAKERDLITDCSKSILANWNDYSNMTDITDPDLKKSLEKLWTLSTEEAAKYAREQNFSCDDLLSKSKFAPIWNYCPRPDVVPMGVDKDSLRIQ